MSPWQAMGALLIVFVTNQVAMTDPDAVQPGILHLVDAHLFKGAQQ